VDVCFVSAAAASLAHPGPAAFACTPRSLDKRPVLPHPAPLSWTYSILLDRHARNTALEPAACPESPQPTCRDCEPSSWRSPPVLQLGTGAAQSVTASVALDIEPTPILPPQQPSRRMKQPLVPLRPQDMGSS
jgi:hypothetical protein